MWSLFEATGKQEYGKRARELLQLLREGAPGEDRESMMEGIRLYREIAAEIRTKMTTGVPARPEAARTIPGMR